MATISSRDIERSLCSKGFVADMGHHRFLRFRYLGKETNIRTRLSHGTVDYGDALLAAMRKQLHLLDRHQLDDLIRCPMDGDAYCQILRSQGLLP